MADILMTATKVAQRLHVNVQTVYSLIQKANLAAVRTGCQWRFTEPDITRWLHAKGQMTFPDNSVWEAPSAIPEKTYGYEARS